MVVRHMQEHIAASKKEDICDHPGCHADVGKMADQVT